MLAGLRSVQHLMLRADVDSTANASALAPEGATAHDLTDWIAGEPGDWPPDWLLFDHPLWVVYSSGTTGPPKPIVDGHGGIVLEALKGNALHNDLAPMWRFAAQAGIP